MNLLAHITKLAQRISEHTDECESLCAILKDMGKEPQQLEQNRQQWATTFDFVNI